MGDLRYIFQARWYLDRCLKYCHFSSKLETLSFDSEI